MLLKPPLIFVADDDAMTQELVKISLDLAGFHARTFGTIDDLLAAMAREKPALVLMDVRMPGQSGLDGLRAIKASPTDGGIPVLMLTGDGRLDRIVQAMQLGAAGYVMKPFDAPQLMTKVYEALATAEAPV
jgi:DNA-binding NtrC family response regulator